ncbi:hypothetical protein K505DRAFT_343947 [Melanomma pulvis-pyrius CBS 109.77]|uniref:Uncharacterized protein n=1 Tax=Melanomma pulvis-pyrius CBS 109.77 TaxID=1314802 RepID=A0A6A6WQA4_9PLEO|nr:hypothetical protein K505DRAFT_343947 [Melanomma pulvis-pyrius CBS 109.77]
MGSVYVWDTKPLGREAIFYASTARQTPTSQDIICFQNICSDRTPRNASLWCHRSSRKRSNLALVLKLYDSVIDTDRDFATAAVYAFWCWIEIGMELIDQSDGTITPGSSLREQEPVQRGLALRYRDCSRLCKRDKVRSGRDISVDEDQFGETDMLVLVDSGFGDLVYTNSAGYSAEYFQSHGRQSSNVTIWWNQISSNLQMGNTLFGFLSSNRILSSGDLDVQNSNGDSRLLYACRLTFFPIAVQLVGVVGSISDSLGSKDRVSAGTQRMIEDALIFESSQAHSKAFRIHDRDFFLSAPVVFRCDKEYLLETRLL